MKRTLSIALITALLCSAVTAGSASCGNASAPVSEGTSAGTESEASAEPETTAETKLDLPETDMEGKEFTIMTEGWCSYSPLSITDISAEELNGEPMNDAVYSRFANLTEKYNCKLNIMNYENNDSGNEALIKSVAAGENAYDIALVRAYYYNTLISGGNLCELGDVPHLKLSADWYDQSSLETLSVLNNHYGVVSNLTMNSYYTIFCTYFNKRLMSDYNLGNIYDIIRGGGWTIDKMYEMGKLTASDVNSDGTYDNLDHYAFTYIYDDIEGLLNSCGVRFAELDKDGEIDLTYRTQTATGKMLHLFDILSDTSNTYNVHTRSKNAQADEVGMFMDRKALFSLAGIYYAPQYREMNDDFGIIPMPKYDEKQENYLSPIFSSLVPVTVVPVTNTDLENTGILIEQLSYDGYKSLYPALFDTLLKGKITRDDDSNEMLDLIFRNTYFDTGLIFNFGDVKGSVRTLYCDMKNNFSSTFDSIQSKVEASVNKLIDEVSSR